MILVVLVKLNS